MYCTRPVTKDIVWIGGNDRRLALFENLFPIPRGVSYNSYLILDEKTALMDTVDASIGRQFFENIEQTLQGRPLDYLIVNHMEPDHCANIEELTRRYPDMKIVGNRRTIELIKQFYDFEVQPHVHCVEEGDTLCLGTHTLQFIFAPMVHWPEVMMAYETSEHILFSADAFGSFGAVGGTIFQDELHFDRDWLDDARRYYSNIVGKYGPQVQAVLKKASALDIKAICPLHGPVWRGDLGYFLNKYDLWSRYEPEDRGVAIFYGSMYGDTANAADLLAAQLAEAGVKDVRVYDVSCTHVSYLIAEAFRCSHLVFAAPTYNNGLYPAMETLLLDMKALNLQNRTVGLIENGSWAPQSGRLMREMLGQMKDMHILETSVTIKSSLKKDQFSDMQGLCRQIVDTL
ncbi:FprA family A-type flavoprotein [Candidatus Soleaferrea massiliensis]|uniref:FprA family A-type flavoprotein n=1 Tax=Candidatus Soleaferrea massiliensis TaxID=1470354 RepID=UPI000591135D|nr:FprA family A-type flavoprotein [Candidatus Soleaferrea massiliensis]